MCSSSSSSEVKMFINIKKIEFFDTKKNFFTFAK